MNKEKITLFVMTQKGFAVLNALIAEMGTGIIDKVISSRDTNIAHDHYDEIKACCQQHTIPFYEKNEQPEIATEFAMAISWRWLINLQQTKLIVLHDSLLPRYRGFAPLITALINEEKTIGVTALFASKQYDRGDIITQEAIIIEYPLTIKQAIDRVAPLYVKIAVELGKMISSNISIKSVPQNDAKASYSLWLDDTDYFIDWSGPATAIKRFIDAVGYPYKGACTWDGEKLCRIIDAVVEEDVVIENRICGKLIFIKENEPVIVCGTGLLRIKKMTDDNNENLLPLKKFRTRLFTP